MTNFSTTLSKPDAEQLLAWFGPDLNTQTNVTTLYTNNRQRLFLVYYDDYVHLIRINEDNGKPTIRQNKIMSCSNLATFINNASMFQTMLGPILKNVEVTP